MQNIIERLNDFRSRIIQKRELEAAGQPIPPELIIPTEEYTTALQLLRESRNAGRNAGRSESPAKPGGETLPLNLKDMFL